MTPDTDWPHTVHQSRTDPVWRQAYFDECDAHHETKMAHDAMGSELSSLTTRVEDVVSMILDRSKFDLPCGSAEIMGRLVTALENSHGNLATDADGPPPRHRSSVIK